VYADGSTVTGFVGRVTALDATTITVSLTAKSGTAPVDGTTNTTLKIGGAWKGPNGTVGFPFNFIDRTLANASGDNPRVNFKSGTDYSVTAAVTHTTTGVWFEGYTATPGDDGFGVINGGTSGSSYLLLSVTGEATVLQNLEIKNNGASGSSNGLNFTATDGIIRRVVVHDVRGNGISLGGTIVAVECEAYACNQSNTSGFSAYSVNGAVMIRCIAHDNTGSNNSGFRDASTTVRTQFFNCIADSNGLHGFVIPNSRGLNTFFNCDAYNNGGDGFIIVNNSTASSIYMENCNAVKNTGWGIRCSGFSAGQEVGTIINCGFGAGTMLNGSGDFVATNCSIVRTNNFSYANDVTPWVDPANGDFRINLAAAKGAGRGTFLQTAASYAGTIGYPDIGAAQHADSGGSGGAFTFVG
jgi:hypothetical protein